MTWRGWAVAAGIVGAAASASAQERLDVRAHFTKQEVMIPMRDGVKLFTSIYVPKDSTTRHPILMRRTPYSCFPYGPNAFPPFVGGQQERHMRAGYIIVCQDVRGQNRSEGAYANVRPYLPVKRGPTDVDETTDTYDTVEWLIRNLATSNGRVGISGISYPGFYTWMGTIDAHPAVKATSPQAPVSKWMDGDDFYHNGALLLSHAFDFYASFGRPRTGAVSFALPFDHGTPDGYAFFLNMGPLADANATYFHGEIAFWDTLTTNDQWNAYWAARNILPHLAKLRPATLVVGGWFDTENLFGALNSYQANERQSPGAENRIVMGPWSHGQWGRGSGDSLGPISWDAATAQFYTDSIEGPFFDYYLKGEGTLTLPEAWMFDTGRKRWQRFDAWPPPNATTRRAVLGSGGRLTLDGTASPAGGADASEYVNDPAKPVPYTNEIAHWYNPAFMLEDQRFASRRPDVLVFQTEPLTRDVTVAGPIQVHFTVSTSGTDADWVVKLIDVLPDDAGGPTVGRRAVPGVRLGGYQMLVRGDVLRGKFRNGLDKPQPFTPDTPTALAFTLQDAFHTFQKGHRIMIQVQSSWFPMVDLNPGVFKHLYEATAADFRKTTQRVYHSTARASYVELTVIR